MRVLDLFSGIGGFSLGLERAGMTTVAFCEIDPYCRDVLRRHWPEVQIYDDVTKLTADTLSRDGIAVDVICGGFPCQDISYAGARSGLEGARSGLWREYARLIGELRPRFVVVENVPGLLSLGMGAVLGDLSALGYDAVWDCIPASAVGAPHRRDRVWIIANAGGEQHQGGGAQKRGTAAEGLHSEVADAARDEQGRQIEWAERERVGECGQPQPLADAAFIAKRESSNKTDTVTISRKAWHEPSDGGQSIGNANRAAPLRADRGQSQSPMGGLVDGISTGLDRSKWPHETEGGADQIWSQEPDIGRVAKSVESRVDRLKCLGNAVVPQIPEMIGRAIMQSQNQGSAENAECCV